MRNSIGGIAKASLEIFVLRCRLSAQKACKSRVVLSTELTAGAETESTIAESKLHSRDSENISRAGVEWRTLDGTYCERRFDK